MTPIEEDAIPSSSTWRTLMPDPFKNYVVSKLNDDAITITMNRRTARLIEKAAKFLTNVDTYDQNLMFLLGCDIDRTLQP